MKPLLHRAQVAFRVPDIVPLGQQHVGTEIGLVERREEILGHKTHYRQCRCKKRHDACHDAPPPSQQGSQQAVESAVKFRIVGIVRGRVHAEHEVAEKRRLRQGQHPAQQQRQGQHDEQRLDDLGHGRRRQVERQERENGDQRRAEQAPARGIRPVDDRTAPRDTPQHGLLRVIGHHDGIVHEHTHGDDEPGERRTVEPLAQELHQQQRTPDGEQQRAADQHPGAETHDEHDDQDDDRDRLGEVQHEGRIGLLRDAVLGIKHRKIHADGHLAHEAVKHADDLLPGFHHVDLRLGRNADAHGTAAVDSHERLRRVGIAPFDAGDVAQAVLFARGSGQHLVRDIVEALVGSGLENLYLERPGLFLAAVDDGVLLADGRHDRLGADSEVGKRCKVDIDVHDGRLLAEKAHLLHAVDRHERRLDPLCPVAQLRPGEAPVDRQAVIDTVDVAEIVGHGHGRSPGRQPGLDVEYLAPQFIPQLGYLGSTGRRV